MTNWIPVTKAAPCPICGKLDWCCVGERFVNCMRAEGGAPCKNGGQLFPLGDTTKLRPLPARAEKPVTIDAAAIMAALAGGTWPEMVEQFAASLGVTVRALDLLEVAWSPGHRAWAVPMFNERGEAIGIRLRALDGQKWAVRGSRQGLFIPADLRLLLQSSHSLRQHRKG